MSCQNLEEADLGAVKMIYKYPSRGREFVSHVIETTPELRTKLLLKPRIFVGWASCRISDHVTVLQCFKCLNFGHKSANCKALPHCARCAGDHETLTCGEDNEELKCFNCVQAKCESTDHSALDGERCSIRKRRITAKVGLINYG